MALPPTITPSTTAMITISQDKIFVMAHSSAVIFNSSSVAFVCAPPVQRL
jgi:hypothetical protein